MNVCAASASRSLVCGVEGAAQPHSERDNHSDFVLSASSRGLWPRVATWLEDASGQTEGSSAARYPDWLLLTPCTLSVVHV